jgi:hypothetical protein
MTFHKAWVSLAIPTLALALVSCEGLGKKDTAGDDSAATGTSDSMSMVGFLKTDYQPLVKWLDSERFDVDYKHMTPQLIFDQVPLNDIFYETSNLPTGAPAFNFAGNDLSRREILKKIANHWKLKMSFAVDASGKPTAVKVEG